MSNRSLFEGLVPAMSRMVVNFLATLSPFSEAVTADEMRQLMGVEGSYVAHVIFSNYAATMADVIQMCRVLKADVGLTIRMPDGLTYTFFPEPNVSSIFETGAPKGKPELQTQSVVEGMQGRLF